MRPISPPADRVVIQRVKSPRPRQGLIITPAIMEERPQEGVVRAVGPGRLSKKTGARIPMDVKVGDRVIFGKFAGSTREVDLGDDKYLIMDEGEILGVVLP